MSEPLTKIRRLVEMWNDATPHPRQRPPEVVQFPINNVCNSGCQMCDIWKRKKDSEISPDQVRDLFGKPLFSRVHSIGLNGGEPTLRKDFKELARAVVETLPSLKGVSLITNGIVGGRVRSCIDDLAEVCADNRVTLDVMISIDGIGDVHDRVRGRAGNFESASAVVDHVLAHPGVHSKRIGCTVIRENVFDVENVLDWARKKGIYARFRSGVPHQRLYSDDGRNAFAFTEEEKFHFCNFLDELRSSYETSLSRNEFYLSLRNQIAYGMPRTAGCTWKNKGVTVLSDGGFAYCAVKSPTLGNAIQEDVDRLYWGNGKVLADINETKCADCRHDYEGIASRRTAGRELASKVFRKAPPLQEIARGGMRLAKRIAGALPSKTPMVLPVDPRRGRRILVVGWYGTETLGDKAILGGLVGAIRSVDPAAAIDIASLEPYVTEETKRQMPELSESRVLGLDAAESALCRGEYTDYVFGGGPLMSSIHQIRRLADLAGIAKRSGAEVLVAGCGVGPVGDPLGDEAIRRLLAGADKVLLRDEGSAATARSLGVRRMLESSIDPAFLWVAKHRDRDAVRGRRILLALRDWPIHEYASGDREAAAIKVRFDREILEFVQEARTRLPGYEIRPFCMHRLAVGGDDLLYYRRLLGDFPEILERMPSRRRTPLEELKEFETAAGVLAMRFHSVVFGLATTTPTLAIDYTRGGKIAAVLKDNGFPPPTAIDRFDGRLAVDELVARLGGNSPKEVETQSANEAYTNLFSSKETR